MGEARVPRRSFKTAYTSKKTKTMSATLRGSIIRLKYSVYGSSSNISRVIFCSHCSSVKSVAKTSTDVFCNGLIVTRSLEKDHFNFRLRGFDSFFDLLDRVHNV